MTEQNTSHHKPNIFFILGCQRSGTTLMRLILESHSKISCVDEFRAYLILKDSKLLEKEFEINSNRTWLGFKTPRITEQLLEPILADAGADYIRINNNFRNQPIIFMVRNPLDTIASMKKLGQDDKSWLEMWAESTINFWRETLPDFENIYRDEISLLEKTKFKATVAGAIYWKVKTSSYHNYIDNGIDSIRIRYEDLVIKPKETISQVLNFLKVEWEDTVLSHEKVLHTELDESGLTIGKTDPKLPIYQSSLEQYSKYLNSEEILETLKITKDMMLELNYSIFEGNFPHNQVSFDKLQSIPMKKISYSENNSLHRWIRILQYDIKVRDEKLVYLTHVANEIEKLKKNNITNQNIIDDKESLISKLQTIIKEKEDQIANLQSSLKNSQKTLDGIHNSFAWKLLWKYSKSSRKQSEQKENN